MKPGGKLRGQPDELRTPSTVPIGSEGRCAATFRRLRFRCGGPGSEFSARRTEHCYKVFKPICCCCPKQRRFAIVVHGVLVRASEQQRPGNGFEAALGCPMQRPPAAFVLGVRFRASLQQPLGNGRPASIGRGVKRLATAFIPVVRVDSLFERLPNSGFVAVNRRRIQFFSFGYGRLPFVFRVPARPLQPRQLLALCLLARSAE